MRTDGRMQDELTGALIGLAKACGNDLYGEETTRIIIEGLFTTVTNVSFHDGALKEMIEKVKREKERIVPNCAACFAPCGNTDDYDMNQLWNDQKAVCILLTLLHLGIKNIYLGPTLPAFLSDNVLGYLVDNYDISPISTPEQDLKKMLG